MRRKTSPPQRLSGQRFHFNAPSNRVAWWAAFLATIVAILVLNLVRDADAAMLEAPSAGTPTAHAFPFEEEEEGEGEEFEDEVEECEGDAEECLEEEELEEEPFPPTECLLESTDAAVAALPHNRVQLSFRFTARVPAQIAISYRLQGTKGSLNMGTDRHRVSGSGILKETEAMGAAQMSRVLAARSFNLVVRPLGAPRYCHAYFDQKLNVKRATRRGPVWLGPESSFRPGSR